MPFWHGRRHFAQTLAGHAPGIRRDSGGRCLRQGQRRVFSARLRLNGGVSGEADDHNVAERDSRLRTSTPATIRPIPTMAGRSSVCPKNSQPIVVISTMPTADQMA